MREPLQTTQTLNDDTFASHPGLVVLSEAKLQRLQPELFHTGWRAWLNPVPYGKEYWLARLREQLSNGDSRAAIVVHLQPLLIAAYTDELDCVAMLHFDEALAAEHSLQTGARLLTVNTYSRLEHGLAPDLTPGPDDYGQYGNFAPFIAEFLSEDNERIAQRKSQIEEDEWQRTRQMGEAYLKQHGFKARDGRPLFCERVGRPIKVK